MKPLVWSDFLPMVVGLTVVIAVFFGVFILVTFLELPTAVAIGLLAVVPAGAALGAVWIARRNVRKSRR